MAKTQAVRRGYEQFLNGELLAGFFIWLTSRHLRSVGDILADTVILRDPESRLQPDAGRGMSEQ